MTKAFFDSNIILYLISGDVDKAARSEALVAEGGVISVQVLNEFTSVALRKYKLPWSRIRGALDPVRYACAVESVSVETHERATVLAERYEYSFYDALILAAALIAGCSVLYSEDMQDGQVIDGQLTIRNPYR